MKQSRLSRFCVPILAAVVTAMLLPVAAIAQTTTSSIRVIITNESGAPVAGVPVEIVHLPTGRSQSATSNTSGIANARGLAVGGPYQVNVASGADYVGQTSSDIITQLDETELVSLVVRPSIEEITVTAQQGGQAIQVGVGRDFDRSTIEAVPSVSRDFISTLATDPKILVDNSVARGPAVSFAGQNFRFNSVTIDGVAQNDNFGLSKNASATQRTPISIDAIEALNVNIAPYDVTYGNFVGGNINIVTKSGTNDFEGSAFYFRTDDSFTGDKSDGVTLGIGDFSEDTYGFTFGGPIVRDKLFFFTNYEKFETDRPSNTQTINNIAGVTQADVDRVRSVLQTEYGFDPGPFAASDTDEDEKFLVKLDWFVNDDHRAAFTYQRAEGDVIFDDFPEVAVLQSNRYNINEKLDAYSLQVFSNWTDNFSTELKIGSKDVENRQISVDTTNPDFAITAPDGGTIAAGGDRFRHTNELDNESTLFKLKGDYQFGDHVLTAGFEREEYTVRNLFLPFSKGNYVFGSIDDLEARNVAFVLYGNSNTGIAGDAEANFDLAVNSFYLQDEWTPSSELTLRFGLRFDEYDNSDPVPLNTAFEARNGFSNQENLDGKDLVLPRFGFNWDVNDRLTLRGGAGLFGGGTPLIVLSNSYSGNGVTRTFASFLAPFFGPPVSDAIAAAVAELPDPTAAFRNLQPFIGVNPDSDVDLIDPNFEILSTWKYSLGAEYVFGDDWIVSGDIVLSEVKDAYNIFEGRRNQVGTAPDGRPIYDITAGGDYIVTNTGEGSGTVITVGVEKLFETDYGRFDFNLGYTYQDVDELRSYNRFVGFETYAFDAQPDLNNGSVGPSKFEVENRVTANLIWQKELFADNTTTVGLTYAGRSGRHYSYVFGSGGTPTFGGTFLADFGSEGDNPGPMLFYVPTGVSDPLITGDPAFLADLDQFISSESCLAGARGSIVGRNSCETDWVNILSLRLQQEIRVFDDKTL
ncbi:MAG: TonB-dependent receptor, partial [Woeseiaceae bacterium]